MLELAQHYESYVKWLGEEDYAKRLGEKARPARA